MKQRILATFMCLCLVLGLMPTVALAEEKEIANGTSGGIAWKVENNVLTISVADTPENGYNSGDMPDYARAANQENSVPWYSYLGTISEVILNEGVKNIGDSAFYKAKLLTSITYQGYTDVPLELGIAAIGGCSSLTSITGLDCHRDAETGLIFEGLNEKEKVIGFSGTVESVKIPDSVTTIGLSAFNGCTTLKSIDLGEVQVIEDNAFNSCTNLTTITFPNTLRTIGDWAFGGGTGLTVLALPEGVVSIGIGAFGHSKLKEVILPNSIENIGNECFAYSNDLEKVTLPGNLQTVGRSMFHSCKALKSIKIPEGITTIEQSAFHSCSALEYVWLPTSLKSIGNSAFFGCTALNHINIPLGVTTFGTTVFDDSGTYQSPLVIYVDNNEYINKLPEIAYGSTKVSKAITNGGTFLMDTEFEANTLAAPVKHANIFSGWYTSDDFKEGTEVTGSAVPNTTYYAKWTESTYSLSASSLEFDPISYGTASEAKAVSIQGGGSICSVLSSNPKVFTAEIVEGKVLVSPADTLDAGTYRETIFITASDNATFFLPVSITISKASASIGISANPSALSGGGTVTLTVNKSGLPQNAAVSVSGYSGILDTGNGTYTVTLPNATADYTFTVQYQGDINHLPANAKCTVSVTQYTPPVMDNPPSSGSGYLVSLDGATDGGTVTVRPVRADQGELVTITVTPDPGYVLDSLTVQKANGTAVPLTKVSDSVYTFQMPDSRVTVSATFKAAPVHSFTDVKPADYYYDAVLWAAANGVTNGITATTFGPELAVSRAQMVTFLWRASGSPKATGTNPFADVSTSDYYYDAVLWAVANGVTKGTSSTTFSPDAAVTRAQAVTFQWRAAGTPAAAGSSFADVPADAYFANAVAWAVANGITNGTSSTTFSPDAVVTRAQAVAFLYRAAQ